MGQILLIILILMASILTSEGLSDKYIGTISTKGQLIDNREYDLDLDGDGIKEVILEKSFMKNDEKTCTQLYINDKIVNEYTDYNVNVYLKDFNKVDNTREICVVKMDRFENVITEILFYEEDNVEIYSVKGKVTSYDNKNGLIRIENIDLNKTSFMSFGNIIGSSEIYIKNSYKRIYNRVIKDKDNSKVYLDEKSSNKEFIVINDIKAYESIEESGKHINLKSEDKVNIISLNKVGKDRYIKVKYNNKYWWIKCGDTQLFSE